MPNGNGYSGDGDEQVGQVPRHNHAIGNLVRTNRLVELSRVLAAKTRSFVNRAVAIVTVVTYRDGIAVQHGSSVTGGMVRVRSTKMC